MSVQFDADGIATCDALHDWKIVCISIKSGDVCLEVESGDSLNGAAERMTISFLGCAEFCLFSDAEQSAILEFKVFRSGSIAARNRYLDEDEFYSLTGTKPPLSDKMFFRIDASIGPWLYGFATKICLARVK